MRQRASHDGAGSPERGSDRRSSHITSGHVRAFQMVTSQLFDNVVLWSCWINGEPGVAIVLVQEAGEGKLAVMPLFVAITDDMELSFEGARETGGSDGGGPRRSIVAREFEATKAVLAPG